MPSDDVLTRVLPLGQQRGENRLRPPARRLRFDLGRPEQPFREQWVGDKVANSKAWSDRLGEGVEADDASLYVKVEEGGDQRLLEVLAGLGDDGSLVAEDVSRELEEGVWVVFGNDDI